MSEEEEEKGREGKKREDQKLDISSQAARTVGGGELSGAVFHLPLCPHQLPVYKPLVLHPFCSACMVLKVKVRSWIGAKEHFRLTNVHIRPLDLEQVNSLSLRYPWDGVKDSSQGYGDSFMA